MATWEPAARDAIREVIARYAQLIDRGRIDEVVALFAEDASLEAGDRPPARGRDAIRAFFLGTGRRLAAATTRPLIRHHVSTVAIDLEGPTAATATSYFLAITERGPDHWGRYRDRFVLRDGRWLIGHRLARADGYAAGSAFAPGLTPPGAPRRRASGAAPARSRSSRGRRR
jgi:ketosteroid isomerase-like protein